jgi:hypothetical protein
VWFGARTIKRQVCHLCNSIPALRAGGADQIFVALRDIDEFGPDSPFASEGILGNRPGT